MPPPIPTIDVKEAIAAMTSISSTLFICEEVCLGEMSKINCKAAKVKETAMIICKVVLSKKKRNISS